MKRRDLNRIEYPYCIIQGVNALEPWAIGKWFNSEDEAIEHYNKFSVKTSWGKQMRLFHHEGIPSSKKCILVIEVLD